MSTHSAQDIAFSASGLTRYFGNKPIVKQCSFSIPRGTVTGLLGLNGTGKTTTIRMLMGFLPPTRGSSTILGVDSQSLSGTDRSRHSMSQGMPCTSLRNEATQWNERKSVLIPMLW